MTLENLKLKLSQNYTIQICKEGVVFTLLLTGTGLSNWNKVNQIMQDVTEYTKEKFPNIEAMRNDETFCCIVLKQKED